MNKVLQFQDDLSKEYYYGKLPKDKSDEVRDYYRATLPSLDPDKPIYTLNGTLISEKFKRVVIGDYGAFIEFSEDDLNSKHIVVKNGQEYRVTNPKYAEKVKYIWLTVNDDSDVKLYYQKRCVTYADYKRQMFYVSPHEITQEV